MEVEDAEDHKVDSGQPWKSSSPIRISYSTRRSAERAMTQGRWFHGQSLNLVWVSVAVTNRPSESAPASITALTEHKTTGRGDANEVWEESSVEEQHHVESKASLKNEAHPSGARVV